MFNTARKTFAYLARSRVYWLINLVFALGMIMAALYYQHKLGQQPCVMCIQVRLLFTLLVIAAMNGMLLHRNRFFNLLIHLSVVVIALGLVERSYQLLGTERGFVFGDCGFDPGLPAWLALDVWLPWLYRVETSCGYTPEIIFGITMAEMLIVISALLFVITLLVTLASIWRLIRS